MLKWGNFLARVLSSLLVFFYSCLFNLFSGYIPRCDKLLRDRLPYQSLCIRIPHLDVDPNPGRIFWAAREFRSVVSRVMRWCGLLLIFLGFQNLPALCGDGLGMDIFEGLEGLRCISVMFGREAYCLPVFPADFNTHVFCGLHCLLT